MSPIAYIPHAQIDKALWDRQIESAALPGVYATSAFLDCMHPGWDALVYGDYAALMPVTHRRKWGIGYVCQPPWAQQLGVYTRQEDLDTLMPLFINALHQHYKLIEIYLHEGTPSRAGLQPCTNYVLPLQRPYPTLRAGYKRDLLKNLARCSKFALQYMAESSAEVAIQHYAATYGPQLGYAGEAYRGLLAYCSRMQAEKDWLVRSVYSSGPRRELLATGLFLKDIHRLYNIASTTLPNGRMMEANHFLMDALIQEFANTDLLLDFEGSDLPGVARFYQKFGPENRPYFFYRHNALPRWVNGLRRMLS